MENGESSSPVSPSPSVAPLNPEVILTEVNSESEAEARKSFNTASSETMKVGNKCFIQGRGVMVPLFVLTGSESESRISNRLTKSSSYSIPAVPFTLATV